MVEKYSKLKKRSSISNTHGSLPVLKVLNEMVEDGIIQDFAIGGGFATSLYSVPYTTKDIDVFCIFNVKTTLIDLSPIYDYLLKRGAKWVDSEFVVGNWPIEFIPPTSKLAEEALKNASSITISGIPTKLFTPEYIVAIALEVNRPKDKLKSLDLFEYKKVDVKKLEEILKRHNLISRWEVFKNTEGI